MSFKEGAEHVQELWEAIVNPLNRVSSICPWTPQSGLSNLHIADATTVGEWSTRVTEKTFDGRADRKMGYFLPRCIDNLYQNLTIQEPELSWLGLGLSAKGEIRAFLNGVEVPANEDVLFYWLLGMFYVRRWIPIKKYKTNAYSNGYSLALCDNRTESPKTWLRQIVGVVESQKEIESF